MMKKLLLIFIVVFSLSACNKDKQTELLDQDVNTESALKSGNDFTICHYTGNDWHIITINPNAWPAHEAHGDAADMDSDGYFDRDCGCGEMIDCNDEDPLINPGAEEICDNGVDDNCNGEIDENCGSSNGEPAVLLTNYGNYILEVQPADYNSNMRWMEAENACENLVAYGHDDWYLPSIEELSAMYQQLGPVENGFGGNGSIISGNYWSSTSTGIFDALGKNFETGNPLVIDMYTGSAACRCVRKQ